MENRDFNEGGAEPDCLYPTQVSRSEIDVSLDLGVKPRNEPENCSRSMARQGMTSETQSSSGLFEERLPVVKLSVKKMKKEELRKFDIGDAGLQDIHQADVRFDKGDAGLQDIHQYRTRFDRGDAVIQDIRQNLARIQTVMGQILSVYEDIHRIAKQQFENLDRLGTASPLQGNTSPETIMDPEEQDNKPNNGEPVPAVNTGKKRRYGKFKGIQPVEIEEVPVNLPSGPSVPLLIGIPATDVVSVGRGSHAEEASQNGTKWRNFHTCCCSIM